MRDFNAWSAQNITALTIAKAAMKVQTTNTKDTKFFHLAQGKLNRKNVVPSCTKQVNEGVCIKEDDPSLGR
jgi:hypothetical protein